MNLEEWRAQGRAISDISTAEGFEGFEHMKGCPGRIYPGGLILIAYVWQGKIDGYFLVIANMEYNGSLEELEETLFEWAKSEGYWD